MNISVKIEGIDSVNSMLEGFVNGGRFRDALAAAGEVVSADAKANCPVDTGYLRNSIAVQVDGNSAVISASASYAAYVEFGTGGGDGVDTSVAHTTKGSWVYCKNGRFYTTSGQPARPFLVPALTNNVDAIIAQFKAALGGG